jgi:drug/metabolite transporter (DMT)-like permease
MSYYIVKRKKIKIFNQHSPLLLGRGLTGAIALSLYFYTIQNMPLATAVTILYLAPIFTVVFAIFMNKEKPNNWQWPCLALSFLGAALMKNFDPRVSLFHFSLGITAAIFAGLAYNFIRKLKGKADPHLIILYFPLITIPLSLPFTIKYWVTPSQNEIILLILVGLLTQLAQIFMTKAYLLEKAAKISHFNYLTSIFAFLTGILFFNEVLNTLSIIGLVLVIIGILINDYFSKK